MIYGLTPEGFVTKDLQTIKEELQAAFKSAYGDDLDVSDDSVTGQLIGNLSVKFSNIWELIQAVYEAFNPDRSQFTSLDSNVAMVGVIRLPATPSTVVSVLYGDIGTVIPVDHRIKQDESNEEFLLDAVVTIGLSDVIDIDFSVSTVLDTQLYTVTINGTGYDYTSDADATEEEIIDGLKTSIDLGAEPIVVLDNLDGTARIYSDDGFTPFSIAVDANLAVDTQASPGDYTADNDGAISVPSDTMNIIVTPIAGLDAVNNLVVGFTGREIETDQELRIRRRELLTGIGSATDEAIRASLLQEVDGVSTTLVVSNRTDVTDGDGRPPHSFEAIVSGGDEQDIADRIWIEQPSGIQSYGSITKTVVDSTGRNQTIKFSRPANVYTWVEVDYTLYSEENFPDNGEDVIKENIVTFSLSEYTISKDVIRQRLSTPIYEVPGIEDIVIRLATSATPSGPPGAYAEVNVEIAGNELAVFDDARITTTLV